MPGGRAIWSRGLGGGPSAGGLAGLMIVGVGVLIGAAPMADNSFLTHLATGREILGTGSVPDGDPYSFTAAGAPWVVQSWLASVVYATLESIGGLTLVRLAMGVATGLVAGVAWALLRPVPGLVTRVAIAALFLLVGAQTWAERPLMFGLAGFAAVVLAAEGRLDVRWLVPIGWVWANTHGSFPLAVVYLLTRMVGARLDHADREDETRSLLWFGAGVASSVIGPLGLRALTFPLALLGRQEVLSHVVEWQSPAFTSVGQRAFLVLMSLAILMSVRNPRFRDVLPLVVFFTAALLGARNVAVASIVALPLLARALPPVGAIASGWRPRRSAMLLLLLSAALCLAVGGRLQRADLELQAYPIASLAFVESEGIDLDDSRLAARELVGNLLTYVYGARQVVFYDDRFDMYPEAVSEAAVDLDAGRSSVFSALDEYDIDLVIVPRDEAAAALLAARPEWRVLMVEDQWQLTCRRGADLGPASC